MKIALGLALLTATWLTSGAATASTRFDFVFTGLTSTFGPTTPANGTGFVEVDGYTGSGLELFGGADPTRTIVDFRIDLALASFDFGSAMPGYPTLKVENGVGTDFRHIGILIGAPPPTPYVATFDSLRPGAYQLAVTGYTYTGTYTLTRYVPPPPPVEVPPGKDAAVIASPVPEPASWTMMIVGFLGLGAMVRAARRRGVATAL